MSTWKSVRNMVSVGFSIARNDRKLARSLFVVWGGSLLFYLLSIAYPTAQSNLLDGVIQSIDQSTVYPAMLFGAVFMVLFVVYKSIYFYWVSAHRERAVFKIQKAMQNRIFEKKLRVEYGYFETPGNIDRVKMVQEQYAPMFAFFFGGGSLISVIGSLITFVCVTLIVARVHLGVALLLTVGNLFGFFKTFSESKWNYYQIAENMRERRFAGTYSDLMQNRSFIKEIRLLGIAGYLKQKWEEKQAAVRKRTLKYNVRFFLLDLLIYGLNYGFIIAALVWTAYLIFQGRCSAGAFLLVYSSSSSILDTSGGLFSAFYFIKNVSAFSFLYDSFLSLPETDSETKDGKDAEKVPCNMDIDFKNVTFSYEGMTEPAISDVTLHISQGERVAIVGANGSGKTTIVSLLNAFFTPQQGEILLGNIPVRDCISDLRHNSAILLQDFGQYETSIRENIAIGAQTTDDLDGQIVHAAEKAGIWSWISSLPNGLDTPVGRYEEGGINLSGGQWQKMAIARTAIRNMAFLLVMDEPNASLDPVGEIEMYHSMLDDFPKDRTLLLISHRLGVVRNADRIIVMGHGKIEEEGTHEELMSRNGLYQHMFSQQASLYQ